ncbi:MAG: type II secretion system F family protein [Actinomycetota bacterium]|nr:type II secretion system F family protein [Actinomycetota bacterium]
MNRRLLGFLATAAIAALLPLTPAFGADETLAVVSTDVSAWPEVRLVIAAPPQFGDQVLTDTSFRVTEGGESRPVSGVEALGTDQLEVALALDTSGSMLGAPLAAAKAAARSFLAQLPATVPLSVVGFGASPAVVSPRSSDRAAQASAVNGLVARGQTGLYDALNTSLAQLPAAGPGIRRVIVLLTDGGDTSSRATLDATAQVLAGAGVPLFAVELRTSESNPDALAKLTSASGGRVVPASDPAALTGAFEGIAKQLVRSYTVTYRSEGNGRTDVDVVLEAQGVRASARRQVELPPAPASAPVTDVTAGVRPDAGAPLGGWALALGGGLCGAAMLVLLLGLVGSRAPKARGLATTRTPRGGALSGAADRAEVLGETVLRRRGGVASVGGALEAAGLDIRPGELFLAVIAADLLIVAIVALVVSPIAALLVLLIVPMVARLGLDALARRRRKKFTDQLAETLQILSGTLRAGHGLSQGIDTIAREAESPTSEEVRRLSIEIRLGRDLVDGLKSVADRMESEDFRWVAQAIEIQRDVGGDLAEVLDSVASTIRDRTRIRRQVSALSAEGRMSAWVLMILPFGLAAVMGVTNPDYLSPLFSGAEGYKLLAIGAALLAGGGLWLRRIVKPIF